MSSITAKLGQDTEYFLWDTENDKYVPSWAFLPPPDKKHYTGGWGGSAVFRDGFAMEVNTGPAGCRAHLWEFQRNTLLNARRSLGIPARIQFSTKPLVRIDHLLDAKEEWPTDVKILGCNPTMDAYTGDRKEIKRDPLTIPFRTSGAHMHISGIEEITGSMGASMMFIKLCDLFIGLPLTVMFGDDLEYERRTLYGQAGEFRMQRYTGNISGIEYRVPSTRLYCHPSVMGLAFAMMRKVCAGQFEALAENWNTKIEAPLRKAINTGKGALEMLEEIEKMMDFSIFLNDNSGIDRLIGGWECRQKYRMHNGAKFNMAAEHTYKPFKADIWLKMREMVNPDLNPEQPLREAHYGFSEYMAEWYPNDYTTKEVDYTEEYNRMWGYLGR